MQNQKFNDSIGYRNYPKGACINLFLICHQKKNTSKNFLTEIWVEIIYNFRFRSGAPDNQVALQ